MSSKLKQYNISLTELGEMFGYKNQMSFLASKRKKQVIEGAEKVIAKVEAEIIERLKPPSTD